MGTRRRELDRPEDDQDEPDFRRAEPEPAPLEWALLYGVLAASAALGIRMARRRAARDRQRSFAG